MLAVFFLPFGAPEGPAFVFSSGFPKGRILRTRCKFQPRQSLARVSKLLVHMKLVCTPIRVWFCTAVASLMSLDAGAQVAYSDSFNVSINYLTNGIAGTIWDGIYFGAGEFANSGVGGGGPGSTVQCDANLSAANTLTLQTTGTAWEGADDDGFFLFKIVRGDFSATVHVVSPFNNAGYNTAGMQARAFAPNGDPSNNGKENYVSWTRFDEFNFPNYLRSELNGAVMQINPGGYPNANYWLRMDRVRGTNFMFYQKSTSGGAWQLVNTFPAPVIGGTNLRRGDLLNLPMQVGIIHATFNNQIGAQFTDFSLTVSNAGPYAPTPAAATGLTLCTNAGGLNISWVPGAGSVGSLVAVWTGANPALKEIPANGFTYNGNSVYGHGDPLPGTGHFVVYAGSGTNVIVTGLLPSTTYNVAVFSYAGSGNTIAYSHSPAKRSLIIPPNDVYATADLASGDVFVSFSANPGKWYWLQYSDSLNPAVWQTVLPGPLLANSTLMSTIHHGGAGAPQRFYRLLQVNPLFDVNTSSGFITSLQRDGDAFTTEYIGGGAKLGDTLLKYRQSGTNWLSARTSTGVGIASSTNYLSPDGTQYISRSLITSGLAGTLVCENVFTLRQDGLLWNLNLTNQNGLPVEVGDLALPLPMNTSFSGVTASVLKHSFISGYGSFLFWMRPNSVGPYLLLTPDDNTRLEYWDRSNGYEVYIHSLASGSMAATNYPAVTTQGSRWRQTNTSLTLAAAASQHYGFKFQWANDYDGVRQALVNEGKIDVHIVPGMTVPTNLPAQIALNTTQAVVSIEAEFPLQTQVVPLGNNGPHQLYQVQFSRLGENRLTIRQGNNRSTFLEFFVTEPVETLIQKRASFLVSKQINDPSKWYNSLFAEWNMNDQVLVTPDNHDTITGFVVYEIASDDAGESRPAYMGAKEAIFPIQSEVTALDSYIQNFVWGGLQRTTNESFSYGVYGIPDWHNLRTNNSLSLGRGYDYPHIVVMYYGMYQVAKYHPEITTFLTAQEYLRRAYGTAAALFTVAGGAQANQIGLMNEVVTPDLIDALTAEGMTNEAGTLRGYWERKVNYFVTGNPNLFGSEYAFDSTGFESTQAFARYAIQRAGSTLAMGSTNPAIFLQQAQRFLTNQITANVFDRGWLETTYYHYGSDYRGDAGDDYVLSYMSQEGGQALLDYALNFAANPTDYLRLGYGSILSAWATMNTGTPASGYGFWYPGAANDGGCGGGFEPLPYNTTWLGQPMHRGPWYYSCEENLGFCGALRAAAAILADDPIFGRICYGGSFQQTTNLQVVPLDGVRQRFHAMFNDRAHHLIIDTDHFAAGQPIALEPDLSALSFTLETAIPATHSARLHITSSIAGAYVIRDSSGTLGTLNLAAGQEGVLDLPMPSGTVTRSFSVSH
jgi:hypothetical protein